MHAQPARVPVVLTAFLSAVAVLAAAPGRAAAGAVAGEQPPTLLVVNKSDSTVGLVDFTTGKVLAALPTGFTPHEVSASPDGTLAAVSDYGTGERPGSTLTVVEIPAAKVVRTIGLGRHTRPHGVCWFADDRLAVTTEGSRHLLVVDPLAGKVVHEIETGQEVSHQVAVTRDGRRAFVANIGSGSVTVADVERGVKLKDVPTGRGAEGIALTPDGREAWVGNRDGNSVSVIDAESLEVVAEIPCRGMPIRVAVAPDGRRAFVTAAVTGEVVAFDVPGRKEVLRRKLQVEPAPAAARRPFARLAPGSAMPVGLALSPDGQTAVVAATMADKLAVLDPHTLEVRGLIAAGGEPDGLAFSAAKVHR